MHFPVGNETVSTRDSEVKASISLCVKITVNLCDSVTSGKPAWICEGWTRCLHLPPQMDSGSGWRGSVSCATSCGQPDSSICSHFWTGRALRLYRDFSERAPQPCSLSWQIFACSPFPSLNPCCVGGGGGGWTRLYCSERQQRACTHWKSLFPLRC